MIKPQNKARISNRSGLKRCLIIGFGALVFTFLTVRNGIVAITRWDAPTIALTLNPEDARAQARLAELIVAKDPAATTSAARLARNAVAREPSLAPALRTIAIYEASQQRPARSLALLTHASLASKGDVGSQIALIEAAVARSDISTALYHYDIALRSSRSAAPLLYPPLVRASDEASIMLPLTDYLAKNPAWKDGYLLALVQHGPSPPEITSLLIRLKARGLPAGENIVVPFLNRLVAAGDFVQAEKVFRSLLDTTALDRLRDPNFQHTTASTPFDWGFGESYGLIITPGPTDIGPGIAISASPDCCGEVVGQILMLPVGSYVLHWRERVIDGASKVRAMWTLTCLETKKRTVLSAPVAIHPGDITDSKVFEIPADCNAQRFALTIQPGDNAFNMIIAGLSLTKEARAKQPSHDRVLPR